MNSLLISVILLGANVLLFLYALSTTIIVPATLILLLMACVLFANIYKQGTEFINLEKQARRNKKIIVQQKKEIKANQDKLKKSLDELAKKDVGQIDKELDRVSGVKETQKERFREAYWDQLERSVNASGDPEAAKKLKELYIRREEINGLIELSRKKYMKRQLDEESFRDIVRDYQKELIEIEGEVKKLGGDSSDSPKPSGKDDEDRKES